MVCDYEIMLGNEAVGKVQVSRQGLYYRFLCRCKLSGDVIYRLWVRCGEQQDNLGVLVREGDGFGLDKKIPVSHLGTGEMEFMLLPKSDRVNGTFVPISAEEPFGYIERLQDSFLVQQGGQSGIVIPHEEMTDG